jgi:ribulose-5-phosphate 4-epimerase/fuculose-1-phosphate aldolase
MLSKNVSCRKKKTKNHTEFTINKNLKNKKKLKAENNLLMQQLNFKNNHAEKPRVKKQITHSETYDPPFFVQVEEEFPRPKNQQNKTTQPYITKKKLN